MLYKWRTTRDVKAKSHFNSMNLHRYARHKLFCEYLLAVMFEATLVPWAEAVLAEVLLEVLTVVLFLVAFAGFIIIQKLKVITMAEPTITFK